MNSDEVRLLLNKELLTVDEVSKIFRVSWATASRMIGNGLEGINVTPNSKTNAWRIYSSSVKRLLKIDDKEHVPV